MADDAEKSWLQARIHALENRCETLEKHQRELRDELPRRCKEQIDQVFQNVGLWTGTHIDYRKFERTIDRSEKIGDFQEAIETGVNQAILETFRKFGMVRISGKNEEIDPRAMVGLQQRSIEFGNMFKVIRTGLYMALASAISVAISAQLNWSWLGALFRGPK